MKGWAILGNAEALLREKLTVSSALAILFSLSFIIIAKFNILGKRTGSIWGCLNLNLLCLSSMKNGITAVLGFDHSIARKLVMTIPTAVIMHLGTCIEFFINCIVYSVNFGSVFTIAPGCCFCFPLLQQKVSSEGFY